MRIISGKFKGRILKTAKNADIRPTSQKVKQALFSILAGRIAESCFLELFAGSGSVGIEALSRGAARICLVENNRFSARAISQNLKLLGISERQAMVLAIPAERAIRLLEQKKEKFNLVFLDPPYYKQQLKNNLIVLGLCDILMPRSLVIAEHNKAEVLPHLINRLELMSTKRYGDAALSFYQTRS